MDHIPKKVLISIVEEFLNEATNVYDDDCLKPIINEERSRFAKYKMKYSEVELFQILKKVLDQAAKSLGGGSFIHDGLCRNLDNFRDFSPGVPLETIDQYRAFFDMKIKEYSRGKIQGEIEGNKDNGKGYDDVLNKSKEYLKTYVNAIGSRLDGEDEKLLDRRDDLNKKIDDIGGKLDVFQALKDSLDLANSAAPTEEAEKKSFLNDAVHESRIAELPPLFGGEEIKGRVNFEYLTKFTDEQLAVLEPRVLGISKNKFYIGSGVGAGLFLLLILVVILVIYKKRKRSSQSTLDDIPRANVIRGKSNDRMPSQPGPHPPQNQYSGPPPMNPASSPT